MSAFLLIKKLVTNREFIKYASEGNIAFARELLEKNNIDINNNSIGTTALIEATKHNKCEMVAFLLENGASIHVRDMNGCDVFKYVHNADIFNILLFEKEYIMCPSPDTTSTDSLVIIDCE